MTVLPIRIVGDPVLRAEALPVTPGEKHHIRLVEDMLETMDAVKGVGLAAPQVGAGVRIFTYDDRRGHRGHCLNPVLELLAPVQRPGESDDAAAPGADPVREGCLSVPETAGIATRSQHVLLTGTDVHGEPLRIEAGGLLAVIFQHEVDHLNGTLFIDRLAGEERKAAMRLLRSREFGQASQSVAQRRASQVSSAFGKAQ